MNDYTLENEAAHQRELASQIRDGESPVAPASPDDELEEIPVDDAPQLKLEGNPVDVAVRAWPIALAVAPVVLIAMAFRWIYLKVASSARRDAIDQDARERRK